MDSITNGHARVDAEEASSKKNKNLHGSSSLPKQMVLVRGFSRVQANEEIINETRSQIESSLYYSDSTTAEQDVDSRRAPLRIVTELPDYSFMLPDLNKFDAINYKFKEYLQNDLIELPTQYALTESGHLNWWAQNEWEQVNRSLYPMVTSGDGNCLLHAASLAMWGLHDRYLILRKALHASLEQIKEGNESALWRRWKWEQMCQNRKYGLVYNEDEWAKEWQSLLKLSSYQPRVSMGSKTVNAAAATTTASSSSSSSTASSNSSTNHQAWPTTNSSSKSVSSSTNSSSSISQGQDAGTVYFESLEEFHILLLAHILQRPIIIVADTMLHDLDGEPLSPVNFSGIYLPFECELSACHRYPLVLAYDSAHFSALVLMDNEHEDDYYDDDGIIEATTLSRASKIERINKKIQVKPPYAVIPITYANKELLPIHFAHDPGSDYDWSKFPKKSNNTRENEETPAYGNECELTRDEKMFLIQRYLDIVRMQLYDPGPTVRRNNSENVAVNSSGMRVNISNVRVTEPFNPYSGNNGSNSNFEAIKTLKHTAKKTVNKKIQKFFNLFKRNNSRNNNSTSDDNNNNNEDSDNNYDNVDNNNNEKISPNDHEIKLNIKMNKKKMSNHKEDDINKKNSESSTSRSRIKSPQHNCNTSPHSKQINFNLFHKIVNYKSWNALFDSTIHHTCLIGVKLNLAKPPKFNEIVFNYIESAQKKFEFLLQHQQKNVNHTNTNPKIVATIEREKYEHICVARRSDCKFDNLCVNCVNEYNKNANIRSIALNNNNVNYNQYSYNTNNDNNTRINTGSGVISAKKIQDNHQQVEMQPNGYDENCHFKSYYL